ncbi:MAG: hypothetical protein WAK11_12020 [Candidatus Cybelea sp.]
MHAILRVVGIPQNVIGDRIEQRMVTGVDAVECARLSASESILESPIVA